MAAARPSSTLEESWVACPRPEVPWPALRSTSLSKHYTTREQKVCCCSGRPWIRTLWYSVSNKIIRLSKFTLGQWRVILNRCSRGVTEDSCLFHGERQCPMVNIATLTSLFRSASAGERGDVATAYLNVKTGSDFTVYLRFQILL